MSRATAPVVRRLPWLLVAFAMMAVAVIGSPLIGTTPISLGHVFDRSLPFDTNIDAQIFFVARLPRALAGLLVGGTLAAAGAVLQGLLRNPLAEPYTLGVSAGASLGAMIAITFGAALPLSSLPLATLAGAMLAVAIVYLLARARHAGLSTTVLLLAGVTLNAFFFALILFVQYLSDLSQTFRTVRWLMGTLDVTSYSTMAWTAPLIGLAGIAFAYLARPLNLMSLGPDAAAARGVDVAATQRLAFISASVATGAAVALGGPIGFIGIIVPHLVRRVTGPDHRLVLPGSACVGAAFLIACDTVARTILPPNELPVGVITAITGGPFFLWMLVKKR